MFNAMSAPIPRRSHSHVVGIAVERHSDEGTFILVTLYTPSLRPSHLALINSTHHSLIHTFFKSCHLRSSSFCLSFNVSSQLGLSCHSSFVVKYTCLHGY